MRKRSSTTEQIVLGTAGGGTVTTFAVQITSDGWTGSITPKARIHGSNGPYIAVSYRDATGNEGTAAITAGALIEINAAGRDVILDHAHTAGTAIVDYHPLVG